MKDRFVTKNHDSSQHDFGFRAGKPTRAIQFYLYSNMGFQGKTTRQELLREFFIPEKGIFLLKQRYIRQTIQIHKKLGLLNFSIPHTEEYTLPKQNFLAIADFEMPDIYYNIQVDLERIPTTVVLLNEPTRKELNSHNIAYFRRYYWSLLFHAEIHKAEIQKGENWLSEKGLALFIDKLGKDVWEEIQTVLTQENCLFDPDNPREAISEFVAYYLQLYNFTPRMLAKFFPTIENIHKVYHDIHELGIDDEHLLQISRPEKATSVADLLGFRDDQIRFPEQDFAIFHPRYHLEKIYQSPVLDAFGVGKKQFEKEYEPFLLELLEEIIHKAQLIGELDFSTVLDKAIRNQVPLKIKQLLLLDKILAEAVPFLYARASWLDKLCLLLRREDFLQYAKRNAARERLALRTIQACHKKKDAVERRRQQNWGFGCKLVLLLTVLWQLLLYLPKKLLECLCAPLEQHCLLMQWFMERIRVHNLGYLLQIGCYEERHGNFAGAFREHKKMIAIGKVVVRRTQHPEGQRLLQSLEAELDHYLHEIEEKFCEGHGLHGDERKECHEFLQFFKHLKQLKRHHRWLLSDLQKSYVDSQKEYYSLHVFRWMFTLGHSKLKQTLPTIPFLKKLKALNKIQKRVAKLRLREHELNRFNKLIEHLLHHAKQGIRQKSDPVLTEVLSQAGIKPRVQVNTSQGAVASPGNQQERIAFAKIKEEVLDQMLEKGHIRFTDLRDIISRNDLKLDDLAGVKEFVMGDPLLRFDQRLGKDFAGTHRRAEIYMRWIHKFNALLFGTAFGRWTAKYILLPFVGALVFLEAFNYLLEEVSLLGPSTFTSRDFRDATAMVKSLREATPATPLRLYLKQKAAACLATKQQEIRREFSDLPEAEVEPLLAEYKLLQTLLVEAPQSELSQDIRPTLTMVFNEILPDPLLHQPQHIADLNLNAEAKALLKQKTFEPEDHVRLNRVLLELTYPEEMRRSPSHEELLQPLHQMLQPVYREKKIPHEFMYTVTKLLYVLMMGLSIIFIFFTPPGRWLGQQLLQNFAKLIKLLLIQAPQTIWYLGPIQFLYKLRLWGIAITFVLKPALYGIVISVVTIYFTDIAMYVLPIWILAGAFVLANLVINSPYGRKFVNALEDTAVDIILRINATLIIGLFQLIWEAFKIALLWLEDLFYTVDDFFRFRKGENPLAQVVKMLFSNLWFVFIYLFRFTINLVVEPQVNPLKHFPIVTVSHKIVLPISPMLAAASESLVQGIIPAHSWMMWVWGGTVWLIIQFGIPGICGFMAWELKENWKLYRRSASKHIKSAMVGSHGENLPRLLKPGFHSGTIPKYFRRLRKTMLYACHTGDCTPMSKLLAYHHHLCESLQRFIERTLVAEFTNNTRIKEQLEKMEVQEVALYTHKIDVPILLKLKNRETFSFTLHYELRAHILGYITVKQQETSLSADMQQYLAFALLVLWKKSAVQIIPGHTEVYVRQELKVPPHCRMSLGKEKNSLEVWLNLPESLKTAAHISYDLREDPVTPEIVKAIFGHSLEPEPIQRDVLMFEFKQLLWERYNEIHRQYEESAVPIPQDWQIAFEHLSCGDNYHHGA